jgi:hypothetical protein
MSPGSEEEPEYENKWDPKIYAIKTAIKLCTNG